jgi:methylaspartate mutase epsilon subunit
MKNMKPSGCERSRPYSILLGGIGGDSHSVGLTVLRQSLIANGYRVHYLGIQNTLNDFFQLCRLFNVVMVSSMDGHSRYYLAEFPFLVRELGEGGPLWYLGGNLCIGDGFAAIRHFLDMRFHRVFPKFADIETVLAFLRQDLNDQAPKPGLDALESDLRLIGTASLGAVSETKLDNEEFRRIRREVLQTWRTGRAASSLPDNARFLVTKPSFPKAQALVNLGALPMLIHPRSGVPLVNDQIQIFRTLNRVGASAFSYQVDSFTRVGNYDGAEQAIKDCKAQKSHLLNGFPVVNHGVPALRRIISSVPVPLQTRHSAIEPALLAEISYAGGVTAFEGGSICYNIPYYKDYPLAESIRRWQYVDRLTGYYYSEFGINLDREFFGTLTGTLIPPCIAIACDLLESILAVQQGVRCLTLGYAEQGHRIQDVAAIRTLRSMAVDLLQALGYKSIQVNTVFHQYMAAFPNDRKLAENLVYNSAVTAALSGATRVMVKTPVEAFSIPTVQDNAQAIDIVRAGVISAKYETLDEAQVAEECAIIRRETQAILDSVILSGVGGVARGIVNAFQKGYLDVPFSPSIHNRGEAMTARDVSGAVRFVSLGNLQFDSELRNFHRSKIDERRRAEGLRRAEHGYRLVEKDLMQIARGEYQGWPLSKYATRSREENFSAAVC